MVIKPSRGTFLSNRQVCCLLPAMGILSTSVSAYSDELTVLLDGQIFFLSVGLLFDHHAHPPFLEKHSLLRLSHIPIESFRSYFLPYCLQFSSLLFGHGPVSSVYIIAQRSPFSYTSHFTKAPLSLQCRTRKLESRTSPKKMAIKQRKPVVRTRKPYSLGKMIIKQQESVMYPKFNLPNVRIQGPWSHSVPDKFATFFEIRSLIIKPPKIQMEHKAAVDAIFEKSSVLYRSSFIGRRVSEEDWQLVISNYNLWPVALRSQEVDSLFQKQCIWLISSPVC